MKKCIILVTVAALGILMTGCAATVNKQSSNSSSSIESPSAEKTGDKLVNDETKDAIRSKALYRCLTRRRLKEHYYI